MYAHEFSRDLNKAALSESIVVVEFEKAEEVVVEVEADDCGNKITAGDNDDPKRLPLMRN